MTSRKTQTKRKRTTPIPGETQPPAKLDRARRKVERIVVPIDFSNHSIAALWEAIRIAERNGATLILVHVMDSIYQSGRIESSALKKLKQEARGRSESELEALARSKICQDLKVKFQVRTGVPYAQIVAAAEAEKAGLIVIASRGMTGIKRLLLGSTAERVVRFAPCTVLVVR